MWSKTFGTQKLYTNIVSIHIYIINSILYMPILNEYGNNELICF